MQNGRNRIAANGRTKSGKHTRPAKAPRKPAAPPAFPMEVAVAAPPGLATPKSFPAKSPKARPARRKPAHPVKQRRPGRKKRAAAREAEHHRQTALVVVAAAPRAAKPPRHPDTPEVIRLADASRPETAALPLPPEPEPLVLAAEPLPNQRALARPGRSLVAAIAAWLGSTRRLLALNLLPRKARKPLPKPPRSRGELNRVNAENAARRERLTEKA